MIPKELNPDFLNDFLYYSSTILNKSKNTVKEVTEKSTAGVLQSNIATWYIALRTIALVGLLSVLVYIGIRIAITSVAAEKGKYKFVVMDHITGLSAVKTVTVK